MDSQGKKSYYFISAKEQHLLIITGKLYIKLPSQEVPFPSKMQT